MIRHLLFFSLASFWNLSPCFSPDVLSVETRQLGIVTSVHHEREHNVVHTHHAHVRSSPCGKLMSLTTSEFQWKKVVLRSESKMLVKRSKPKDSPRLQKSGGRRKLSLRKTTEEPRQISKEQSPIQEHTHKSHGYACIHAINDAQKYAYKWAYPCTHAHKQTRTHTQGLCGTL